MEEMVDTPEVANHFEAISEPIEMTEELPKGAREVYAVSREMATVIDEMEGQLEEARTKSEARVLAELIKEVAELFREMQEVMESVEPDFEGSELLEGIVGQEIDRLSVLLAELEEFVDEVDE